MSEKPAKLCGKCKAAPVSSTRAWGRWCRDCANAYAREWRRKRVLTDEDRLRDASRAAATAARRKGILVPQPCERCGETKVEMHHEDYSKPLEVVWLCHRCHFDRHTELFGIEEQRKLEEYFAKAS